MAPQTESGPWTTARRLLAPSLLDVFFGALLVVLLARPGAWQALLADGDTGWHIRTGELILSTGAVPHSDPFSFTRAGQPWFAWEWLSDVLFALAFRARGLVGVAALAAVVLGFAAVLLLAWMLRRGAGLWIGLAATLAASSASSVHYLARPHVFSILLYTAALILLDRDRPAPRAITWSLVPLCALWANLHAGFVALPATLLLAAAVAAWDRRLRAAGRYGAMALACIAITGLNPYGWQLHAHIARYLGAPWLLDHVQEFQSPNIRSEGLVVFAVLLLAGAAAAGRWLHPGGDRFAALLVFGWGFLALRSARCIPFLAIVAAPAIADAAAAWWRTRAHAAPSGAAIRVFWDAACDLGRPRRASLWLLVAAAAAVAAPAGGPASANFPDLRFPVSAVERNLAVLAPQGRMPRILSSDQWADYLIFRLYPRQRVFFDGRSDYYGAALIEDYGVLMGAQPRWREVLRRYGFDIALLPRDWPLGTMLDREPGWRRVYEDQAAVLFLRDAARPEGDR